MPGFRSVLLSIARAWKNDSESITAPSGEFFRQLETSLAAENSATELPDMEAAAEACFSALQQAFDPVWGGFGTAPKFPRPALFTFLFSHAVHAGRKQAADMALDTLACMEAGGMHDHLSVPGSGGGGFARYSTDERWHVPHFEKMLYDNAQLACSYLDAYLVSGNPVHADTARDIFTYVLHDLRSPEGGFFSAEDADSFPDAGSTQKAEGAFYVWSWDELFSLPAAAEDLRLFARVYGVKPEGNVLHDPHGEFRGKNVLMRTVLPEQAALEEGTDPGTAPGAVARIRELLYEKRLSRPRPLLDDKVITSWNGLMIAALARGFRVLGLPEYLAAARKAAAFVLERLCTENGTRLLRRYRDGEGAIKGKAEDYAFFIRGLLDLYQACFENNWLEAALRLMESQNRLFHDHDGGSYFSTASDDASVPLRLKESHDGAEPSATSATVLNLLDLETMTGKGTFGTMAAGCMRAFGTVLGENGHLLPLMLSAAARSQKGGTLALLQGEPGSPALQEMLQELNARFLPGMTLMHESAGLLPEIRTTDTIAGNDVFRPAVRLCTEKRCVLPACSATELRERLLEISR
jgi:uncharacterized protein YyaL (SSP411 family)